jgi:hypothetical protein
MEYSTIRMSIYFVIYFLSHDDGKERDTRLCQIEYVLYVRAMFLTTCVEPRLKMPFERVLGREYYELQYKYTCTIYFKKDLLQPKQNIIS